MRRHTRDSILDTFERRLANSPDAERAAALVEIGHITRLRLVDAVDGPGKPNDHGRLSTHVLDTASGKPAAGVKVVLLERGSSAEGVLEGSRHQRGRPHRCAAAWRRAAAHRHLRDRGSTSAPISRPRVSRDGDPPFLDVVPVRFAIAEPEGHYHVPLLVSPWSYSTYRGS